MRFKHFFIFLITVLTSQFSYGSHIMGGEITWTCSGANTYDFQLVIYRDCNGNDILANTLNIEVWGHPTLSTIQVTKTAVVDLSPPCTQIPGNPIQLDCGVGTMGGNGSGAIQKIIFNNSNVVLSGTPLATGWSFTYDDFSRSWSLSNIDTPQSYGLTLSATMYAVNNNSSSCVDDSPQFAQDPFMLLCAGTNFEFNSNVYDPNGDSLAFSWGVPLDHFLTGSYNPPINPIPVPFVAGFLPTNPTPDASFNAGNVPASINPQTGTISFTSNTPGDYVMKQKIDSYRNGQLISTVNREIQLVIISCAGAVNSAPVITPPFNANTTFDAEFFAGDVIDFDIIVQDNELLQDGSPQTVVLTPSGNYFGNNFTDPNSGCDVLPCATLNQAPIITGIQGVNTHFNWQTDCNHLLDVNGIQQQEKIYSFVLKAQDDYCSVPGLTYKTIRIKLKNSLDLPPVDMNCVNVLPNGDVELSWTQTDPTIGTFTAYEVYSIQDGLLAVITDINIESYTHIGAGADLVSKDYYVLTKYGCNGNNSVSSDTLRSIFLILNDLGDGRVSLSWNSTIDPINGGDNLQQNIMREYPVGNWEQIGQVSFGTNFFIDTIDVCDAWLNFRIEIPNTAGCLSGSNIDGDQLEDIINPYIPTVISVSVDTILDQMEITWTQNQSDDTYGYVIYQQIGGFWEPIDTVYGITTTTYLSDSNGSSGAETYGVAAFDSCLTNSADPTYQTSALSEPQTSIYLENEFFLCEKEVKLTWTPYLGWDNSVEVESYEVVAKFGNSTPEVVATLSADAITYTHSGLVEDVTYCYYVRAVSNTGVFAYSNENCRLIARPSPATFHYLATASHLMDDEIEIECFTDPNASIQGYELEKKSPGESNFSYLATLAPASTSTLFYNDSEIDAKTGAYDYRVKIIDSCGNVGEISNIGTTVFLSVSTQDVEMKTTLSWSSYFGFDGNVIQYKVYRGVNGNVGTTPIAVLSGNIRSFVDDVSDQFESEGQFCYRVEAIESINSYGFAKTAFSNKVCVSIEPLVYIPNAMTVNGSNPIFLPVISLYDFDSYELQIYNRWGEVVFNTDDRFMGWDGIGNDGFLKHEGVYVYVLRFKNEFGDPYEFKGSLTMIYSNTE